MKEIILIKNGELALKGLNRSTFEDMLVGNIRRRLKDLGDFEIRKSQSTIMVEPGEDFDLEEACARIGKIFGIAGYSRAAAAPKEMEQMLAAAAEYLAPTLRAARTFKVEAKRSDKQFPLRSPEICAQTGGYLLRRFKNLSVDVHKPDFTVNIEVRDRDIFIHGPQVRGAGGMPTGSSGRGAVLISGGIDSPVAAWMMAKRGLALSAVHFASPPYTSPMAEKKVQDLLSRVAVYSGRIALFTVPFTEIQETIRDHCPEEFFTLVMRRMMMRIAGIVAQRDNCSALITGESLGQVASQTVYALGCTDAVAQMPVLRPLIGMDKDEIVRISRMIDTFELSSLPYEDCCTVFTPRHPRTRPTVEQLEKVEAAVDWGDMIQRAAENTKFKMIY
ncbi:MAG TPA: tRNA 4-thiouridine(8) synthase ThiI [Candidatus Onthovicinus excrementipullorum]|nr:tRNA 4-thiouridine(8) synthase ThiI [Candidatus Onthovicinus excrementipullorum]